MPSPGLATSVYVDFLSFNFYVLLIKTVKEERNSERKGRRREPKKKGDVLMAKLPFPLEKKESSVTGTFSRGLDDASSRMILNVFSFY